ncbi:hypothetical protein TUM17566_56870 [Klebsiella pneumoniae]|nr:hypothetical protein TUM17555_56830 [Klebsiella pneumoniae]GJK83635.1 hypothetical protein TUM17566_56870 [Klebsiella pneumoniae]
MCIGVCIDLFFYLIFHNKIILLLLFIGSYYRTSHSYLIDLVKIKFIQSEIA